MRNIELVSSSCYKGLPTGSQIRSIDPLKEEVYFTTQNEVLRLNCKNEELKSCLMFKTNGLPSGEKIISLTCLTDLDALCIITDVGEISLYHLSNGEIENVGSFDDGLKVASWSPDGNNLVLITGSDSIIYMNRDFDIRHEIPLYSSLEIEDMAVSVGWGKKETQFHGSEGKAAALKKDNRVSSVFDWDDLQLRLTWQGDGQLFAVSCLSPESCRQVRIFTCEGALKAVSESLNGLETEISWKPSGNLIAVVQRTPSKYQVIFLEQNGLQHGEFTLPYKQDEVLVKQLLWNPESSLLAVRIERLPKDDSKEEDGNSKILIWSRSNYHWYLKQTLIPNKGEKFVQCLWHPEKPNLLLYLTSSGLYRECAWDWKIHRSHGFSRANKAYIAVIDGDKVLLTSFREKIVPPPHALHTCKFPSSVNALVFPSYAEPDKLAVVLSNNQLVIVSVNNDTLSLSQNISFASAGDRSLEHLHADFLHHWTWIKQNRLTAVYSENFASYLCGVRIDQDTAFIDVDFSRKLPQITAVCATSCGNSVIYQLHNGCLQRYQEEAFKQNQIRPDQCTSEPNDSFPPTVNNFGLPRQCHHIESCSVSGHDLVLGISKQFQLFCGMVELMKNCSSFTLHDKFLVATSLDHKLHCISLASCLEIALQKRKTVTDEVDNLRNVERGSYVAVCVPEDTKVILQMPRGNLECIHPRALLVTTVVDYLDSLKFYDAFSLMRRHRINLNLLFDHNPQLFLNNIEKFVTEVDNVNWLNVFLSDLSDDNITATLYGKIYNTIIRQHPVLAYPDKVNVICERMRQTLEKLKSEKFLVVILSTYVLMKPPKLENALNLINGLRAQENKESTVSAALTHLIYLVDVNELFNIAVGTYDFDLVIMVAQQTQKDPKEYLPFLNELKNLEENYRRYKIDCHLKNSAKALENIVKAGESYFEECLDHIKHYDLYKKALSLYEKESSYYKKICLAYADYLRGKHYYDDAGIFYRRAGCQDKALEAFEKSLNWQQAMVLAETQLDSSKTIQLASRLAEKLKERNQHRDAAYLLESYVKLIEDSILTLIEGHEWQLAMEMIHRHGKVELVAGHLLPSLQEHSISFLSTIKSKKALFQHHVDRLMVVRENKLNSQHLLGQPRDIDDSASEITTITESSVRTQTSFASSRMTGRTSRNRRKEEQKKHSLKEGSFYEDRALMEALREIATGADHMKDECTSLVHVLLLHGYDEEASQLQNDLSQFLLLINENVQRIWLTPLENLKVLPETVNAEQINDMVASPGLLTLGEAFKFMQPPSIRKSRWEVGFLKSEDETNKT